MARSCGVDEQAGATTLRQEIQQAEKMKTYQNSIAVFSVRRWMCKVLRPVLLLLVTFGAGLAQPVITNQPQAQAVAPGAMVTLTVGARGAEPLAYQWQRNPGNGFSDLTDRTNALLVLTNMQPWDAMAYRVVVTNPSGAVDIGTCEYQGPGSMIS